jgi:hypothetical protein
MKAGIALVITLMNLTRLNFSISETLYDGSINPEQLIWFIGTILVVLFIFILVLTLARGASAMAESIGENMKVKK